MALFLDAGVGLDDLAGAKFLGFEDHLGFGIGELLEIGALDVLELHLQHPRLRPFAVLAKGDFADDRVERMAAEVIGELGLIAPDNKRTLTFECIEDGELLTISYSGLKQLYFQNPKFGFYFLQLISRRLFQDIDRLQDQARTRK